ncbi:hypothetical protein KKG83_00185, partial [Candidatus Micrarchaeota archaeon]|nr:hypothetical protein [Candidatus Micrarchaeota archaeon]
MISETLGNIYTKIEEKFYSFFDFLEDKGIPVYKIIDPIEEKGIPFFPLTIALIVILLVALFGFGFVGTAFESKVYLNLKDDRGNTLQGVNILVEDSQGNEMFTGIKNHGDELNIKVQAGAELTFTAEKTGYEKSQVILTVINKTHEVNLSLKKVLNTIKAKIKFYDDETGTAVSGVYAEITGTGIQKNATADKQGLVEFLDIPLEEDLSLTASSDSYNEYTASIRFESDETKSVYLTPKEIALEGESNLIITLFDEEGNLLENAKVKVFDAESSELIDEKIVSDGVYSENFPKGMAVRFTVEKDGFKVFESETFTLRGEEEDLGAVTLEKGGKEVLVNVVYADTGNPVVGAEVTLFNSFNEIMKSEFTLYEGSVLFKGLNEDENYFVGAEKETYLPVIQAVESNEETIELVKETSSNSKELTVLVVDQEENTIENASLYFTKMEEETEIPLGIGVKYTDTEGKFKLKIPIGTEVYVKAVKDLMQGKESFVIGEVNNNLLIRISRKDSVKSIKFFDENGQILGGNLIIKTKEGEILYDGEVTGEVLFDSQGKNFVEIELTTPDGKKYSEELNVEGQTDFEINIDEVQSNEKTPQIEFIGMTDISGNEVEGITKDKEYILKFKTEWSLDLEKGGVHFRTGNDSIKYTDSEDIGITGFDAGAIKYFYGRSFSPNPSPGNEDIDYSNRGQGGKQNKFVEMYFDKPEGTKIIKIRIKASELIEEESVKVKFRAWSELNGNYYRNPLDEVIGTEKNSAERKSLYAETGEIELKVYNSEPECKQEICAEYNIIDEEGKVYDKKDFFALKNKVYALEINLEARKTTQANFKLNTSSTGPRIAFTGSEVSSFSQFADNNKSDTLIEFSAVIPREGTKTRVYFKAKTAGESFIKSRITTPIDSLTENFYFNVFEEKEMTANIPEKVMQGKNFEAVIKDMEGKGIEDAKIVFLNEKGRTEKTIIADEINGKNGVYKIENNLKAGKYLVKITAPKFIPIEKEIQIIFGEGIEIAESITINIPENVLYWKEETGIKNSTEEVIENLSAEIIPANNFPKEFKLNVIVPAALIAGEEKQVEFSAEYSGNVNAILYGEAAVEFTGTIKGIPVKTETKVIVNYNQQLNPDCLEFDRKELKEYLIGSNGNSKQMDLGLKNNCGIPLEFDLEAVPKGNADQEIEFTSGRIRIEKDEVKTIKINVMNKIQRNYVQQTEIEYDLYFKSSQMTKTIPAKIILWHEMFALEVSPAIVLWVTQSNKGEPGIARQALFLRNTGMTDIQNLSFSTLFDKPGNTEIRILWGNLQQTNIQELKKGMALIPPIVVEAQTDTTENQIIIGKIAVTGNLEGRNYTLREINVIINVSSGWSCLEAWGDDLLFSSPKAEIGSIDKTLHITNNCVEPVIIKDITPGKIGGNTISLVEYNYTLYPNASHEFVLRLKKQAETNQKTKIQVTAVGLNTSKVISSMPAEIELAIGKGSGVCGNETTPCKAENETSLEYCDATGNASFYFPTISSNCTDGYCDAEELGKFLSEKFEEEIRKAKLRIADVKTIENLGNKCNLPGRYCTFGALGVSNTSFDFYLKNDNLTKELLESEIEKLKSAELQNVFVRIGENEEDMYSSAGTAFGEHLILIPSIKGCGKYSARILGAVAINGNELRQDSTTLLLYIEKGREDTPECNNRIQNFMNFLPIDESYTPNNSKNSWLGIIVSNPDVKSLQENFSKTLFKDEKGLRVTSNKQNNRLTVGRGEFDQTKGIVKISMNRSGSPDTPKQLDVYITNNFFNSDKEIQNDIAAEAGKIISNLKNGKIEKGCISENEDYLILGSVKNISEIANLQWKDDTKLVNLYPDNYSCAKLKLQSKLEAPEAEISFRFVNKDVQGISAEETVFRYPDKTEITNK